ncbi:hypothetical protein roselon_01351 [Roseibacterium elongatum DSM 19469]|uniref:Uncharacterized protein n=1 Tax=Roseicyclus elongatus DSM 19469 TaxID=1294273 RepID=W8RRC9_9RHOB|nr:hypothetical protein [Roseibacterium elongatum]AHM03739.1 hypothetical protein roselon_01351 [Roseibacterium elongatum DSM 19469]
MSRDTPDFVVIRARRALFETGRVIDDPAIARVLPNGKPVLSADLKARLTHYYADNIRALEQRIGRDLSGWQRGTSRPAKPAVAAPSIEAQPR